MKKINNYPLFHTGICEDAISKRTVISAISGIKKLLNEPIYTVSNRGVIKSSFSEVSNLQGCVVISGFPFRVIPSLTFTISMNPQTHFLRIHVVFSLYYQT